jgi:hypothetical protein
MTLDVLLPPFSCCVVSQKFPFVFKASHFLPAAPRDMNATWNLTLPVAQR